MIIRVLAVLLGGGIIGFIYSLVMQKIEGG